MTATTDCRASLESGKGVRDESPFRRRLGRLLRFNLYPMKYVPTSLKNIKRFLDREQNGHWVHWPIYWYFSLSIPKSNYTGCQGMSAFNTGFLVQRHWVPRRVSFQYWILWLFEEHLKTAHQHFMSSLQYFMGSFVNEIYLWHLEFVFSVNFSTCYIEVSFLGDFRSIG